MKVNREIENVIVLLSFVKSESVNVWSGEITTVSSMVMGQLILALSVGSVAIGWVANRLWYSWCWGENVDLVLRNIWWLLVRDSQRVFVCIGGVIFRTFLWDALAFRKLWSIFRLEIYFSMPRYFILPTFWHQWTWFISIYLGLFMKLPLWFSIQSSL